MRGVGASLEVRFTEGPGLPHNHHAMKFLTRGEAETKRTASPSGTM
jgi:hypothetical protein